MKFETKEAATEEHKTYRIKARSIVNKIYKPLAYLGCCGSNDKMWEYAKARAIEQVEQILEVIPMYTGNLNPKWKKWNDIKELIQLMP